MHYSQTAVNKGTILRMGKGFTLKGIEGKDLADMFHQAFDRKVKLLKEINKKVLLTFTRVQGLNIKVTAILNDTVGTLVAHAYSNPKARIGLIFATGINAAYPEKVSAIEKLPQAVRDAYPADTEMLINTEIDIFGDESYLPLTAYDLALDANHNQPKFQQYEKMMSGAYLGELVRLVSLDFIKTGALFEGIVPEGWEQPWSFPTSYMSAIESESASVSHAKSLEVLSNFNFVNTPTLQDMVILTRICRIVATRSAYLASVAIASMIEQQGLDRGNDDIVVGITGSTYEYYPHMADRLRRALQEWFGPNIANRIKLEIAKDGGSIGGALIAMLCC